MPEMDLTAFRTNLTDVVDALGNTGPLRLTRYGTTVAEIRSATPEVEQAYVRQVVEAVRLFERMQLVEHLFAFGLGNFGDIVELAQRYRQLLSDGFEPAYSTYTTLPEHGPLTVEQVLAYLYFGDDAPGSGDICEWFRVCLRLQEVARERGVSMELFELVSVNDDPILEAAIEAGHTPESFAAFGMSAVSQGVGLNQLREMLGDEPVPADVLALPNYNEHALSQLVDHGLSRSEAFTVFRQGLDTYVAVGFVKAGVRTADEIRTLIDAKVDIGLAQRAAREGIPVERWRVEVPRIQHLRYRQSGALPFSLLIQAANEKVSVTRWDNNGLAVEQDRTHKSYFRPSIETRLGMYPWRFIYPDRVLDVARAGLSPSFITAFARLMGHPYRYKEDFADMAIAAHQKGLTTDMALAISRMDSKRRPQFSPEQLLAILDAGLRSTATAHYLADRYADSTDWIAYLLERKRRQPVTDEFLATIANTPTWAAVNAVAGLSGTYVVKALLRGDAFRKAAVDALIKDQRLDDMQVFTLLHLTRNVLHNEGHLPGGVRETFTPHLDEIVDSIKTFEKKFKKPKPEEADDTGESQKFITAVEYLANKGTDE